MPKTKNAEAYTRKKEQVSVRDRAKSAEGRDIGPPPPVANQARRDACFKSLRLFLETYFPERFPLAWSPDHLKVIDVIERAVLVGGLFALAMPRGSGKTTICEGAVLWATLNGYHEFVVLLGSTAPAAEEMLQSIKSELDGNDLLLEDFPEVCFAVRALEGNPQRCNGQTSGGERTLIKWKQSFLIFPRIAGSKIGESVIKVAGITGRVRGMKYTRSDGRIVRPSFVIPDDPQTEESAYSQQQCARRLKTMNGAVLKLAGPGKKISAVCPCTVIRRGDMADTLLNRDQNPQWQGERCKMLYAFPARMDLWSQYAVIRDESLRAGEGEGVKAHEFYAAHRAEMDAGAIVAWPQRFDPGDLSALETVMKSYHDDKFSFMAEAQNDPLDETYSEIELKPAEIVKRLSNRPRGVIPIWATKLTAFIDVHKTLLYWTVCAWDSSNFTGSVIAYGCWPDQPGRRYWTLSDAQHTFASFFEAAKLPPAGPEGQLSEALRRCIDSLAGADWRREDSTSMRIARLLVDSGYLTDVVFEACRSSHHAAVVMPSKGQPIGAKAKPMAEHAIKPGERKDPRGHWIVSTQIGSKRGIPHARIDTNHWKSFIAERLRQAIGDPGAMTLYGQTGSRDHDHSMLADHLCVEKAILVESNGRKLIEWDNPPDGQNHWFDCLVGCAVGASIEGVALPGAAAPQGKRPKVSFAAQQQAAMQRRLRG